MEQELILNPCPSSKLRLTVSWASHQLRAAEGKLINPLMTQYLIQGRELRAQAAGAPLCSFFQYGLKNSLF